MSQLAAICKHDQRRQDGQTDRQTAVMKAWVDTVTESSHKASESYHQGGQQQYSVRKALRAPTKENSGQRPGDDTIVKHRDNKKLTGGSPGGRVGGGGRHG